MCLVLVLSSGASCDGPTPSYVRLGGDAPELPRPSPKRAQLVAFWATYCPPCREESEALTTLARDPLEDLEVLLVAEDESRATVEAFFGGDIPPELAFHLDEGKVASRRFGVGQLPTSFLVVDGRAVARFDGAQAWGSRPMRRLLTRLVAESPRE